MGYQREVTLPNGHKYFLTDLIVDRDMPGIVVPLARLDESTPEDIGNDIFALRNEAEYIHARFSAEEFYSKDFTQWQIAELDRFLALCQPHRNRSERMMAVVIDIEKALANARRRNDPTYRIRAEITAKYAQILVALGERDGFICAHCGQSHDLTIDHIIPVSAGGDNNLTNLQILCGTCNRRKGAKIEA